MSEKEAKQKFLLQKLVNELKEFRARHTELVSVYVPAGFDINKVTSQLSGEQSTARNIKSATTRKNVTDALEKMIRELKVISKTPENGLAIFSGNVAEREGVSDVRVWSVEPPVPMKLRSYKCGQAFHLEPLESLGADVATYGLLVLDRRDADIAMLKGKVIMPIKSFKSMVPGKYKAGGQSAARFARVREGLAKDFLKKVGSAANEELMKIPKLKGIIVGGPGPTKEDFVRGSFLSNELKERIIGIVDTGYTSEFGLEEVVEKADDILAAEEVTQEKKLLEKFFNMLGANTKMTAYGEENVKHALSLGAVDTLILSDVVEDEVKKSMINKVEESGGSWKIVSDQTREGEQLVGIGKIGAILRYPIK